MIPDNLDLPKIENRQANLEKAIVQAIKNRFRAIFFEVDYQTYADLIEKFPERRNPRLTFDRGVLEVMPLPEHDISERLIDEIFIELAIELEIDSLLSGIEIAVVLGKQEIFAREKHE